MKQTNRALGIFGEKKAVKFLKKHKYKILDTNFTCVLGEVDIVAKDGEYLVFIEVKTRTTAMFGLPKEAVDEQKQRKIILVASYYQKVKRMLDTPVRFDVVQVLDGEIELIKGAFEL